MAGDYHEADIKSLTFTVGRLAGAVEALTSRLNRTDEYIDDHFQSLKSELTTATGEIKTMIGGHGERLTKVEAVQWKVSGAVGLAASVIIAGLSGWVGKIWH
jgi:hypothetical protein